LIEERVGNYLGNVLGAQAAMRIFDQETFYQITGGRVEPSLKLRDVFVLNVRVGFEGCLADERSFS
jgi:hypothetical protein